MIKRIELTNFMSHVHTVIEPAAGLTVLVGPNNCGKSAVVAALQILCRNDNSTYVLRHGQRECSVKIECDDGHVVEWRRKNSPSYTIDGKLFDRLRGSGQPDELHHALRLPTVEAGDDSDFDVHFGTQKSPIFLLGNTGTTAARFFASSSDAIRLVQMQQRHKAKLQEAKSEKIRLERQSKQLSAELAALEPAVELDRGLKQIEQAYCDLMLLAEELDQLADKAAAIREHTSVAERHQAEADSLGALQAPPQYAPADELLRLVDKLREAQIEQRQIAALAGTLEPLSAPPEMAPVETLDRLCRQIDDLQTLVRLSEGQHRSLATLQSPPEYEDAEPLTSLCRRLVVSQSALAEREATWTVLQAAEPPIEPLQISPLEAVLSGLERAATDVVRHEAEVAVAAGALAKAEEELRVRADGALCPTCGAPLDAQRLLASAHAATGGHSHG